MKKKLLFITDPWNTLDHAKDTSLRLIQAAVAQKIPAYWSDVKSIRLEGGRIKLDTFRVNTVDPARAASNFHFDQPRALEPSAFDRLLYRVDPPVDPAYLQPLQMLVLGIAGKKKSQLVNPAEALFAANEKLEPALLGKLMPPSCVSSQLSHLERFGKAEGRAVLKPLHEAQSHGVELLDFTSEAGLQNARTAIAKATGGERLPVLLQRYMAGITEGEQRLWFLDGKLLAHARKRPKAGEFKIDMDQGATLVASKLSSAEKRAAALIAKALKARRIRMAAIDLIDGLITDYNITSPGLITQMEAVTGRDLAKPIVMRLA